MGRRRPSPLRPRSIILRYPRAVTLGILLGGLALMVYFLLTAE